MTFRDPVKGGGGALFTRALLHFQNFGEPENVENLELLVLFEFGGALFQRCGNGSSNKLI